MSFTENLYLKRQLKQLNEENLKLKQIINEVVYGPGAYPAVSGVDLKPSDLKPMGELEFGPTTDELIRKHGKPGDVDLGSLSPDEQNALGAAHVEAGHHIPDNLTRNFPHYGRGVNRAYKFFGYRKSQTEKDMNP
jgi:hypothetical protein